MEATSRVRITFSPSPVATSSPSAREFRPRAENRQISSPMIRKGSTGITGSHVVAPPILPICHLRNSSMTLARGSRMADTSDVNAAEVAAPARASFSGVAPPRPSDPTP